MKLGRNDKCHCLSNKKYKICCLSKDEADKQALKDRFLCGQTDEPSIKMEICRNHYKDLYKDHDVIIISDYLTNESIYKNYQQIHYMNKVIMLAEKNDINKAFFEHKCGSTNDIIVLYRGSYRTFEFNNLLNVNESVDKMIQTRLANKIDKGD